MNDSNWNDFFSTMDRENMSETLLADITAAVGPLDPKCESEQASLISVTEWTDEEIDTEKNKLKELVDQCITVFEVAYEAQDYANKDFLHSVTEVSNAYNSYSNSSLEVRKTFQEQIVAQLVNSSVLFTLSLILDYQLRENFDQYKETKRINLQQCRVAGSTLSFFHYFAETSVVFALTVTDESCSLLACVKTLLERLMVSHFLRSVDKEVDDVLFRALVLSYSLVMHDDSEIIRRIRESGLMKSMRPYLFSDSERFKVLTLLFMVYVANESDIMNYCSNPMVIKFLLDKLYEATRSKEKKAAGYNVKELLTALEKLAALDTNKPLLEELGIIKLMTGLLKKGSSDEVQSTLQILTQLAFNKDLAKEIFGAVGELVKSEFINHKNSDLQKAARDLAWVIDEKAVLPDGDSNAPHPCLRRIPSRTPRPDSEPPSATTTIDPGSHIMISYNWDHQEKVRKIKDNLVENKFEVWYDEEKMGPNLLDSMADAVERAWVVIICYSRKYQLSQNTRLEAEYASKWHKMIIPVRMEMYDPDGWLGILVGQKLYHDFSGDEDEKGYAENYTKLVSFLRKLQSSGQESLLLTGSRSIKDICPVDSPLAGPTRSIRDLSYLDHWNESVVQEWFRNNKIDSQPLGRLGGKELQLFVRMQKESPDSFYQYLLKKITFQELASFVKALERL